MKSIRNTFTFILLILTGIVLGGLLGEVVSQIPFLSFLNYSKVFGISNSNPFVLDFWIVKLVLGLEFRLSIAAIIGIVASIFIYRKLL